VRLGWIKGSAGGGAAGMSLPAMRSGAYYRLPNCVPATSATLGVGNLRLMPKYVPANMTLATIGAEVTTIGEAGSLVRLGIYADDGAGRPSTLLVDAGTINGATLGAQEKTIAQGLTKGWWWFGGVVQNVVTTQPAMRVPNIFLEALPPLDVGAAMPGNVGNSAFQQASVTGALPGTFTGTTLVGGGVGIFGKVA
jgi:hypothetical protein